MERNPVRGEDFDLPEYRRVRERPTLTPAEMWMLTENLPLFERTAVLLAVLTGLRKGEIEALRWEDCGGASLTVDESSRRGRLGTPKSVKSRRTVTLGPRAQALVSEWRAHVGPSDPRAFMFATRNGKPKDLSHVIDSRIKPVSKRLGIPEFSWHALRRSYTSWGRQAGIAAETMRDQLGHSSVLITQDIYSRIERPDLGERIESVFAESEPPNRNPQPLTRTIQ
jgi:integrase